MAYAHWLTQLFIWVWKLGVFYHPLIMCHKSGRGLIWIVGVWKDAPPSTVQWQHDVKLRSNGRVDWWCHERDVISHLAKVFMLPVHWQHTSIYELINWNMCSPDQLLPLKWKGELHLKCQEREESWRVEQAAEDDSHNEHVTVATHQRVKSFALEPCPFCTTGSSAKGILMGRNERKGGQTTMYWQMVEVFFTALIKVGN